jgi:tetratricopeptide (TPR) repeat protein
MLTPVIGLVQVGNQAMADRYTYLPLIGPCVAIVWCASDLLGRAPRWRRACSGGLALLLALLMGLAWRQAGYWSNSETLWRHALECTSQNYVAHHNFARVLEGLGRTDDAIDHYRQVIKIGIRADKAHNSLGVLLAGRGRFAEAIVEYRKALRCNPAYANAWANLSRALAKTGKGDESIFCCRRALELKPDDARAYTSLGLALAGRGLADQAITQYRKAIQLDPRCREAYNNLGITLARCGENEGSLACWRAALEIDPRYVDARNNLGLALAGQGRMEAAIRQFEQALETNAAFADARWNLGAALLRQRKLGEAVANWREAVRLDPNNFAMLNGLAWLLATSADASLRNAAEAEKLAQRAARITGRRDPMILRTLAAAFAGAGRFADARRTAETALALVSDARHVATADALRKDIVSYRGGSPLREVTE